MPYVLPSEINCKNKILDSGERAGLPPNFNPVTHPIISRHFFGVEPPSFDAACATLSADPQYRRQVERLHKQGARPTGELLAEVAVAHGLQSEIYERLTRYAAIPDEALDLISGRGFPPDPIYGVS